MQMLVPMFARVHTHNWSPCQNPQYCRLKYLVILQHITLSAYPRSLLGKELLISPWATIPPSFFQHGSAELDPVTSSRDENVPAAWPIRWLHTAGISHWLKDGTHLNWHSERLLLDFY